MEKFDNIIYIAKYSTEKVFEDYSDDLLITIINNQIKQENLSVKSIELRYSECREYTGEVMIVAYTDDNDYGVGIVSLGEMNLFKYNWEDYTKEGQRIGKMLKKNLKDIKVYTNFRHN